MELVAAYATKISNHLRIVLELFEVLLAGFGAGDSQFHLFPDQWVKRRVHYTLARFSGGFADSGDVRSCAWKLNRRIELGLNRRVLIRRIEPSSLELSGGIWHRTRV